jgi:hypothetical protein
MPTGIFGFTFMLLGLCAAASRCPAQSCPALPSNVSQVVTFLQQKHYNVQCVPINFSINTQGQCATDNGKVNPSTCYGQYKVPPRTGGSTKSAFQIADDEAILTLGTLPPPMNYYGYYTYLNERINPTVSPPIYETLKAPFGPVMNQANANPGLHAELGGSTYQLFGQSTAIITTANTITRQDITSAIGATYGTIQAQNMLYVEKMPVDLLDLGSSGPADEFITAIRLTPYVNTSGQFDPTAVAYMQNPPLLAFRVSPSVPRTGVASATYTLAQDPMPQTKIVPGQVWEQTRLSQFGVSDGAAALNTIVKNVIANRAALGKTFQDSLTPANGSQLQGRRCINAYAQGVALAEQTGTQLVLTNAMNCEDGSPDAAYYGVAFNQRLSYPAGGELVWVGVNHGTLGSSDYSSLAVQEPAADVAGLVNTQLAGSAAPYLGATIPPSAAPYFYVASFSTSCTTGSQYCLYLPGGEDVVLDERAYLAPLTATQPDYTDIIPSVWLLFAPPS